MFYMMQIGQFLFQNQIVLLIFLKVSAESSHLVFSFKDLEIKSAFVFCFPGMWTADIQIFPLIHIILH